MRMRVSSNRSLSETFGLARPMSCFCLDHTVIRPVRSAISATDSCNTPCLRSIIRTACSTYGDPPPLLLAFPVVELGSRTAEHDEVTRHAARADLSRIEELDDVRGDECREHDDANRRVAFVPDLVRSRLAAREAD